MKARRAASVALAALLLVGTAVGVTGCGFSNPQGVTNYEPSDGVGTRVGDVEVLNVIGLTENGDDVSLLMHIVNNGDSAADVNFQYTDADGEPVTETVTVEAHSSVQVGTGDDEAVLRNVGAKLGALLPVYVQYGDVPGKGLQVPLLDGATAAYSGYLPGLAPTPTATPTPTPTATPAP